MGVEVAEGCNGGLLGGGGGFAGGMVRRYLSVDGGGGGMGGSGRQGRQGGVKYCSVSWLHLGTQ